MNKTLLKRLLFETLEALIRLESQIQNLEETAPINMLSYLKVLRANLEQTKKQIWKQQKKLLPVFEDGTLADATVKLIVDELLPEAATSIRRITRALYRLQKEQVLPETELFINSLNLGKVLPNMPELVLLTAQDETDADAGITSSNILLEYLPVQSIQAPLHWMGLLDRFTCYYSEQTLQVASLLEDLNVPEPRTDLVAPLLSLRLLGPGYYSHYVLKAFETANAVALWVVEPILFQELNRLGLVSKDLVILHQSVERGCQVLDIDEPKAWTKALKKSDPAEALLKVVEKVIPERLAFTEKSFMRSQILEDRLCHGTMISAVPMLTGIAQLRDDILNLDETGTVYPLLAQLRETPATPREILNAGWLHKLDESLNWLQTALSAPPTEGWSGLRQQVLALDTLLQKSIEISEVHRVLSFEETELSVPV